MTRAGADQQVRTSRCSSCGRALSCMSHLVVAAVALGAFLPVALPEQRDCTAALGADEGVQRLKPAALMTEAHEGAVALKDAISLHVDWTDAEAHVVGSTCCKTCTAALYTANREPIWSKDSCLLASHGHDCMTGNMFRCVAGASDESVR